MFNKQFLSVPTQLLFFFVIKLGQVNIVIGYFYSIGLFMIRVMCFQFVFEMYCKGRLDNIPA